MSKTALPEPLPSKSVPGKVTCKSAGFSQSAYFILVSHSAKETLLWAFYLTYSSIVSFLINSPYAKKIVNQAALL
jgi:hypothetical protein